MITRTFQDIPAGKITEADRQSFLVNLGWSTGASWSDLLLSKRVLIVSEAGAGKTYECRAQARRLWDDGEPAFFIELAALAINEPRSLLDSDEEARLDAWLSSQSEVATFFLDSIDELKLSLGSFERALKSLKKGIAGQFQRARIVVTTRPVAFDEQLIRRLLPVPPESLSESNADRFAKFAMRDDEARGPGKSPAVPDWRSVALMPLSDKQIVEFASVQGVTDPESLLRDLRRRNAQEFARRPQDLIELCADWREHKRIRTHRDQVATNVRIKLLPRDDRPEPAELSVDKAIEGASRLALAMQVTRCRTIRYSATSGSLDDEAALDPGVVLPDWQPSEQKALLERPLFGFASYGRVRFHHRSVSEFLAAERLRTLRDMGMPFRALKRLLFAETKGKTIVRPSKRPLAGWLALSDSGIFELLRDNEPAVLLDEGDPESLSPMQRIQALRAYAARYGPGGWRGITVPHIQVHRFASNELACEITDIWRRGVENPEVREVLINLIEAGQITECGDIAFDLACDKDATAGQRIVAIDALVAVGDGRLGEISTAIANADTLWPDGIARGAALRLFPKKMSVEQLCQTLRWVTNEERVIGGLSWQMPRLIANSELDYSTIERLRDGLVELVSDGLKWSKKWPHIKSDRKYLSAALAAICVRGLDKERSDCWFRASILALRLYDRNEGNDEAIKSLRERLNNLDSIENSRFFWTVDTFLQSLHESDNPWNRLAEIIIHEGSIQLTSERDLGWITVELANPNRGKEERAMLLEAALRLSPSSDGWKEHANDLKSHVADEASLVSRIIEWVSTPKYEQDCQRWERMRIAREAKEARRKGKDRASWVRFWGEVANHPDDVFSPDQAWSTAWNLWCAMSHEGEDSRSAGWNRRFIEEQFGPEIADKLRQALMNIWRNERPTLRSERPEDERNSYLVRWQLGLAAIYAESEDPNWANKLDQQEAQLAARYAPIELNGLPIWMDALVKARATAVDQTLGQELSWELRQPPPRTNASPYLLWALGYSPGNFTWVFLPRLQAWLEDDENFVCDTTSSPAMADRLRKVTRIILARADDASHSRLLETAHRRLSEAQPSELRLLWLSVIMRLDAAAGVLALESEVAAVEPARRSEAVTCFAELFGDQRDSVRSSDDRFTPQLLLRLLRLAYRHVCLEDDAHHVGTYSPDTRDGAERARNEIVTALFNARGEEGWAAKLEMAADPLFGHFKYRILAVAEERWAEEIDAHPLNELQAALLDKNREGPAVTNEGIFAIMKDRLSDLDDLLLSDDSPKEAWAGISGEKVMRREIARELRHAANSLYTVSQESVTAEEKETDIRIRSVVSDHEAVIELKLADQRTAKDLLDTIENQLVKKYLAPEKRRSGALLVTLAKNRTWLHPNGDRRIDAEELLSLLHGEAERVQESMGGEIAITVHFLDLRPRLALERGA